MNTAKRRILSLGMSIVLLVTLFCSVVSGSAVEGDTLTIYHTNDMHSNVYTQEADVAKEGFNLAHVAALHNSTPLSLLLDAGDATQGKPLATLSKGGSVIELMNAAGYDAMVVGNHELDFGQEALLANINAANFPVFAGNMKMDPAKLDQPDLATKLNTSYVVKEVGGYKVAIFGVITPETSVTASPDEQKGITYEDVGAAAKRIVAEIKAKEQVNAIICLSHCGVDSSTPAQTLSTAIAEACGGDITVIIDGHSHTVMMGSEAKEVKGTKIVSTGSSLENLGKLEIQFDTSGKAVKVTSTALTSTDMAKVTPDATAAQLINKLTESQKALMEVVVGKSASNLYGGNVNDTTGQSINVGRLNESNLCNLVTDSFLWYTKNLFADDPVYKNYTKLAYVGGGSVRMPLDSGEITMEDVMTVLPFSDEVSFLEVSPATLYRLAEVGVGKVEGQNTTTGQITGANGRFVQPAGWKYEVDYRKPAIEYNDDTSELIKDGSRITKITLDDGTVLDRNDTKLSILLLSNSYDFSGGDGHHELKNEAKLVRAVTGNIFADYIRMLMTQPGNQNGFTVPLHQGRIVVNSGYTGNGFDVVIKGSANTQYSCKLDGKELPDITTDADGDAVIKLDKNGPQELTLSDGTNTLTALVDNYVGFTAVNMMANPETGAPQSTTVFFSALALVSLAAATAVGRTVVGREW